MTPSVAVRPVAPGDAPAWIRLRTALWPGWPDDHPKEIDEYFATSPEDVACFVVEDGEGVVGFAEVALRRSADGCSTSPVGYLEGIYVASESRQDGCGRALVRACEAWARAHGCTEMASDRALDNDASGAFHLATGFDEVGRVVTYRKEL